MKNGRRGNLMMEKKRTDFCTNCRKNTSYTLQKQTLMKSIRDEQCSFRITAAICDECGGEMSIHGLIDQNIREIDEQYRAGHDIVSIDDIEKLMKLYQIGKGPLSLVLGFGEVTITRYLSGQIPTKQYSNIIQSALASPAFMKQKLNENRHKIADTAFHKAMNAAIDLEKLFSVSDQMLSAISYVFKKLEEVTPLMLQKLLYFTQGISYALNEKPMFKENCQAWLHGPVYPQIFKLFRDFRYNPIEDARFAILDNNKSTLNADDRKVIDLVVNTFGEYSGKTLERITHCETPWISARKGYGESIPSTTPIPKQTIKLYYEEKNAVYDFSSEAGLRKYIKEMLSQPR